MSNAIRIDTGIREFPVTDSEGNVLTTVRMNPTDMNFVELVFDALEDIDRMYTGYHKEAERIGKIEDDKEAGIQMFDLGRNADTQIREKINNLFGRDLCTEIIGTMSILTPAEGFPLWANIIFGFIDLFDSKLVEEKQKQNPRIEKYTKKYSRKR